MTTKHLIPPQVAVRWSIKVNTLDRWRSEGIGPVFIKLQGRVLYRLEDIEAFERNSLRQSTGQAYREGGAA